LYKPMHSLKRWHPIYVTKQQSPSIVTCKKSEVSLPNVKVRPTNSGEQEVPNVTKEFTGNITHMQTGEVINILTCMENSAGNLHDVAFALDVNFGRKISRLELENLKSMWDDETKNQTRWWMFKSLKNLASCGLTAWGLFCQGLFTFVSEDVCMEVMKKAHKKHGIIMRFSRSMPGSIVARVCKWEESATAKSMLSYENIVISSDDIKNLAFLETFYIASMSNFLLYPMFYDADLLPKWFPNYEMVKQ